TKHFADFGQVENVAFIHAANDLTYTRACKVKLQSVDSVTKILETPHHVIDGREVTVEKYLGESEHQWLFYKGKFKLILKGLDVNQTDQSLYTYLETAFAKCGRYSEIRLRKKPNGSLKGVAENYFIKKKDIPKALKLAREELELVAFASKN
nr:hypothetical protein [Tanacetum cinerariifolium]